MDHQGKKVLAVKLGMEEVQEILPLIGVASNLFGKQTIFVCYVMILKVRCFWFAVVVASPLYDVRGMIRLNEEHLIYFSFGRLKPKCPIF